MCPRRHHRFVVSAVVAASGLAFAIPASAATLIPASPIASPTAPANDDPVATPASAAALDPASPGGGPATAPVFAAAAPAVPSPTLAPLTSHASRTTIRYDPADKTGFVGAADLRNAFGWSAAELAQRASGLEFAHEFWSDDTYSVSCGGPEFSVVHHLDFGRFTLVYKVGSGGRAAGLRAYRSKGFEITGATSGISGTSVAPGTGQPCPEGAGSIVRVRKVSSSVGWALTVSSGGVSRELLRRVYAAG